MIQRQRICVPLLIPDGIYENGRIAMNNNLTQILVLGVQSCSLKAKPHIPIDTLLHKLLHIQA